MQFSIILTFLSAAALIAASPMGLEARQFDTGVVASDKNENVNDGLNNGQSNLNKGVVKGDYTVSQAISSCGNGQLNCCNYVEQSDQSAEGLVGVAANVLGPIATGCSPISALLGSMDQACSQNTVCCMGPSVPTQFGLINIACSPINLNIL